MNERALRRALGQVAAAFALLHVLPVAYVWLSSGGPAPLAVSARAWSLFFYIHFIALVVFGFGLQAVYSARTKLFYGGPMIDFLLGVVGFMILESVTGALLRRGGGAAWPALLPGLALLVFGLRLTSGRPLLGS